MRHLIPRHIAEQESDERGIKEGWYAMHRNGTPRFGPFASRGECLVGIAQSKDAVEPRSYRPGVH